MSNYVYTNSERNLKLYAKDCNDSHRDIKYYCPTPGCPARLTIKSIDKDRPPYFSALPSCPHNDSICTLHRISGKNANYDVSNFSIESLYNSIISRVTAPPNPGGSTGARNGGSGSSSQEITTTTKLYYFCKGHDISHEVNNSVTIKDLIADSRTNHLFENGISGFKLVESKFLQYINPTNTLKLTYSINPSDNNHFPLTVNFRNPSDYTKLRNKIFNHRKEYSSLSIIVLGNWTENHCTIENLKQIILV